MGAAYDAQSALIRLLIDPESLEMLAREGLDPEVIPSQEARPIVAWSLEHLNRSGKAPTIAVLEHRWGDEISDLEIDLEEDPEESIEQAITTLNAAFVRTQAAILSRRLAEEVSLAAEEDRLAVFSRLAGEMAAIELRLTPKSSKVDMRETGREILAEYHSIVESGNALRGMSLGLRAIDEYTGGIWPGELCAVAAPPKSKKSWFADYVGYQEWKAERICTIYTLENSIKMTQQRIACIACGISISDLMRGKLDPDELEKIEWWVHDVLEKSDVPLPILSPEQGGRTANSIIAQARALSADSLVIDQLTHMENETRLVSQKRTEEIWDITSGLKVGISTGRRQLPCLMIHQINREGVKDLEKTGRLRAYHAAESSAVERTADWLFGLYSTEEQVRTGRASFQPLAVRRQAPHPGWELNWHVDMGLVSVRGELVRS